jgi:RHS repeat-associated protein
MNRLLFPLIALALSAVAHAQKLSDVILSLDDRQRAVDQRSAVSAALHNELISGDAQTFTAIAIDWHFVGTRPGAPAIDGASLADRIALLNQACGVFKGVSAEYLNLAGTDVQASQIGCLRGFMQGDFPDLPRVDPDNYQAVLRQLAWQVRQLQALPWVSGVQRETITKTIDKEELATYENGHIVVSDPVYAAGSAEITGWDPTNLDLEDGTASDPVWTVGSEADESAGVSGTRSVWVDSGDAATADGVHSLNCQATFTRMLLIRSRASTGSGLTGSIRVLARTAWTPLDGVDRPDGYDDINESAWKVLGSVGSGSDFTTPSGSDSLSVPGEFHEVKKTVVPLGDPEDGRTLTTRDYTFVETGYTYKLASLIVPAGAGAGNFARAHEHTGGVLRRVLRTVFVPVFNRGLDAMANQLAAAAAISPASGADGRVLLHPRPAALFGIDMGPGLSGTGSGMVGVAPGIGSEWGYGWSGQVAFLHFPPEDGGRFDYASRLCFFGPAADYHLVYVTQRDQRQAALPDFGRPVSGSTAYDTTSMFDAWDAPRLRQVVGRELIADVTFQGHYGCTVSIYRRLANDGPPPPNGVPVNLSGKNAIRTWSISNPDATTPYPGTKEHLEVKSGNVTHTVERNALVSQGDTITFSTKEAGLEKYKKVIQNGAPANPFGPRQVTESIDDTPTGTWDLTSDWNWFEPRPALVSTWTSGAHSITTTATFDFWPYSPGSQGALHPRTLDISDADQGDTNLVWDEHGILTAATHNNWSRTASADGFKLTVTTAYDGSTVATDWTEFTGPTAITRSSAPDGVTGIGGAASEEILYGDATTGLPGLPHKITRNDGTSATYAWTAVPLTLTVLDGKMSGETLEQGTKTVNTFNTDGYPVNTERWVLIKGQPLQIAGTYAATVNQWNAPEILVDFKTHLASTINWNGDLPAVNTVTGPLGTESGVTARDALDRPTGFVSNGATGTVIHSPRGFISTLTFPGAASATADVTWDALGRPTKSDLNLSGVVYPAGASYSGNTATISTGNLLTGASCTVEQDTVNGGAVAHGSVLPFGDLTNEDLVVEDGLIVTKISVTGRPGVFQTTWTDAWGRVRKTSVPSTTGTGADVSECFYSPPESTIRRVIIQEPSTRHIIRESDPYNTLGITSRIGIDSVSDSQLDDSDRQLESITTIDDGKLKTVLTGPGEPTRRPLLVTWTNPATGVTTNEIDQGEETLTTTPNFTARTVETVSTKGWKQTGTINTLGLPTQTTFGPNTGGPDAFLTTTVNAAWRDDGTLSGTTLQTGTATTSADFAANGLLTGLSVPILGDIFGGHSFDLENGKETLTLAGVETKRAIDGTAVSLTKAANTPDSAAPNLTPVTRTLALDNVGPGFKTTIAPGTGSPSHIITNAAGAKTMHDYATGTDIGSTWLPGGYLAGVVCARGGDITFGYSPDGARDLLSIAYPAAGTGTAITEEFTHYPSGRTKTIDDPSGSRLLTYTRGHLWQSTWVNTGAPLSGYEVERITDSNGRLQTVNLRRGGALVHTHTIGYNGGSSEPSTITTGGFTASYDRANADTRAITSVTRGTLVQTWIRGTAGRIQGASAAGLSYTHSAWDVRARRKNLITPNGSWSYDYDSNGQLERATKGTIELNYTFDAIGRWLGFGDNGNDPLNQFIALTNSSRSKNLVITANPGTEANPGKLYVNDLEMSGFDGGWLYPLTTSGDAAVWIPWTVRGTLQNGGDHAPNAEAKAELSGYTYIPPKDESFTYDVDGNRTGSALWTYRWDGRNKLIAAATKDFDPTPENNHTAAPEGWKVTFDYDAEGRRFQKTVIHKTTKGLKVVKTAEKITYLWDGWNLIYERHENEFGMRLWDREYLWGEDLAGGMDGGEGAGGAGGLLLIRDHRGQSDTDYYPCYDTSGHVIALTDSAGEVTATYDYGPFGELLSAKGPMANANPFRYATKYYDAETGLYYFGHRYYDPATAQWMNREPLGESESLNLYSYCHNDPVNRVDRLGLASVVVDGNTLSNYQELFDNSGSNIGATLGILSLADQAAMTANTRAFSAGSGIGGLNYDPVERFDQYLVFKAMVTAAQEGPDRRRLEAMWAAEAAAWDEVNRIAVDSAADIAGLIDPTGAVDTGNAARLYRSGRYVEGTLTGLGVVPVVGDLVGKGLKYAGKGARATSAWILDAVTGLGECRGLVAAKGGLYSKLRGEPMDPALVNRIKTAFEGKSPGHIFGNNAWGEAHLGPDFRITGETLNERVIALRIDPSTSSVYEELIHTAQIRRGMTEVTQMEIEAAQKLIRFVDRYHIPPSETAETIQRLKALQGRR